jgi:hypothetical protein
LRAAWAASSFCLPYRALKASESMQSNTFPKVIKFYTDFVNLCLAHFAGIKPVNISNSQVGLNAYCGVSVMLLGILFLLDNQDCAQKADCERGSGRLSVPELFDECAELHLARFSSAERTAEPVCVHLYRHRAGYVV